MENEEEWAPPPEPESLFDEIISDEEDGVVWLEPGHAWIEHDEETWDESCFQDDSSRTVRGHGYLTDVESDEVLTVYVEEEDGEDALHIPVLDDEESPALREVFRAETETFETLLARRLTENDPGLTPAVRSSLVATQKAARRLQGLLGEEKIPLTAQPAWPTPHATPFPPYCSDASREWWAVVKAPFLEEAGKLSREEPILGSRVKKLDQHLERKGLKVLDRVRGLLPSLRMLKQEQLVELLKELREAGYGEIARSLHREWLGPTKAGLLARTSRDQQPPPAPIRELLDAALPNLEEAGKVKTIEKCQLETIRKRLKLVEHVLSNLTE